MTIEVVNFDSTVMKTWVLSSPDLGESYTNLGSILNQKEVTYELLKDKYTSFYIFLAQDERKVRETFSFEFKVTFHQFSYFPWKTVFIVFGSLVGLTIVASIPLIYILRQKKKKEAEKKRLL